MAGQKSPTQHSNTKNPTKIADWFFGAMMGMINDNAAIPNIGLINDSTEYTLESNLKIREPSITEIIKEANIHPCGMFSLTVFMPI